MPPPDVGGGDATDIEFEIDQDDLVGEVKSFTTSQLGKTAWNFEQNGAAPGSGTGLVIRGHANRDGDITLIQPSNPEAVRTISSQQVIITRNTTNTTDNLSVRLLGTGAADSDVTGNLSGNNITFRYGSNATIDDLIANTDLRDYVHVSTNGDGTASLVNAGFFNLSTNLSNNGSNYAKNTAGAQAVTLTVDLDGNEPNTSVDKNIDYTTVESAWTNRVDATAGSTPSTDEYVTPTLSSGTAFDINVASTINADGLRGYQYIPDSTTDNNDAASAIRVYRTSGTGNAVGDYREIRVEVGSDSGAGEIAPGDIFEIKIQERLHTDERNGIYPEPSGGRAANPLITLSYTAQPGDDALKVAEHLAAMYNGGTVSAAIDPATGIPWVDEFGNVVYNPIDYGAGERATQVGGGVDTKDLPTLLWTTLQSDPSSTRRFLEFSSHTQGEDFDVEVSYNTASDSFTGTGLSDWSSNPGGLGDPDGTLSEVSNISTFRIPKSISYFEEMLAQNEAETSRLMKAMEHLEDSMIHNEDALSKVQDTDYSQASVEQMRNAVKMQMANNVIGKSMRINDLLIDLTTKHHRGSMLNAKA